MFYVSVIRISIHTQTKYCSFSTVKFSNGYTTWISPVLNNYKEQNKIIYSLNEYGNKTVNTGISNVNGQVVLR